MIGDGLPSRLAISSLVSTGCSAVERQAASVNTTVGERRTENQGASFIYLNEQKINKTMNKRGPWREEAFGLQVTRVLRVVLVSLNASCQPLGRGGVACVAGVGYAAFKGPRAGLFISPRWSQPSSSS